MQLGLHYIAKQGYFIFSRATKIFKLVALLATNDLSWIFTPEVTINRRLTIGRDGNLDQSEVYDYRKLYENTGPGASSITSAGDTLLVRRPVGQIKTV